MSLVLRSALRLFSGERARVVRLWLGGRMFQAMLREVVDGTDGAIAGLLMGFDGITVDSYTRDEGSLGVEGLEALGSEYSQILGQIKQAVVALELGEAREVAVSADNRT